MVQLSFLEEIKDKASRLIPTAYMEIVEECTAPHLLIPTYEHVKFLCETVNKKPDAIVDVVRALRRRIADNDVAVKHLTVQLLEAMIKNSATAFHIEVASQKGLLRDLVNVACMQPTTGRAMQAKEAALLLTLNLSIWFHGHPAEECYILTTLANDVRNQLGPNCFEGIEPERNTRVRVQLNAPSPAARANPRPANSRGGAAGAAAGAGRGAAHRQEKRNIVDAIPVNLPNPERISAMLDACMTFSEYLNNAAMNAEGPLTQDEVVQSYRSQVKADHDYVTLLLSSNLQLDRDILRTVSDSQSAVLKKLEEATAEAASRAAAPPQQHPQQRQSAAMPVSAVQHTPVRSAVDTESAPHGVTPSRATPPRAEVAAHSSTAAPAPPPQVPAPSVDDLFGDAMAVSGGAAASFSSSSANAVDAPAPLPMVAAPPAAAPVPAPVSTSETSAGSSVPAPPPSLKSSAAAVHADPAPAPEEAEAEAPVEVENAEEEKKSETMEEAPAAEEEEAAAEPAAEPAVEEQKEEQEEEQEEEAEKSAPEAPPVPEAPEAPVTAEAPAAPAAPSAPAAPAAAPAASVAAPAAAPKDNDDDFDAFLDGRM